MVYLTYWFPRAYRARVIAAFLLSVPLTSMFGAPLATSLMQIEGWGLRGWQWLFLLEGIPSVLIGIAALWYLTDHPSKAHWLLPEQREWLARAIVSERDELEAAHGAFSAWRAMIEPRVLALCLVYIGSGTISYGVAYFLPQIIKGIGLSVFATGFVTAIPAAVGVAGMLTAGWFCDRSSREGSTSVRRRPHDCRGGRRRGGLGWLDLVGAAACLADGVFHGSLASHILVFAVDVPQP